MEPTPSQNNSMAVPIAIIVGFALIALAIFFTGGKDNEPTQKTVKTQTSEESEVVTTGVPRQIDDTDYIRGNPNAPILIVEYSDYDCPFCKQFHDTLGQIVDEFGINGQVAWVYRQFPLTQLHPNAAKISEAALCVGDIGGNDAFWKFSDLVFEQRDLDEQTNVTRLTEYAEFAGINTLDYNECINSGRMKPVLEESIKDGLNIGARGTPYTLLIAGNQQAVISGAQPYNTVHNIISELVDQLNGRSNTETPETE